MSDGNLEEADGFIDSISLPGSNEVAEDAPYGGAEPTVHDGGSMSGDDSAANPDQPEKKEEAASTETPTETQPKSEQAKEEDDPVALAEKRRKDSETAFNEEHKARLALEKKFAELEAKLTAPATEAAQPQATTQPTAEDLTKEVLEKWEDDPSEAIKFLTQKLTTKQSAELESMRQELVARELDTQEAQAKQVHSDYDEVMEFLVPKMKESPTLHSEWQQKGGTAEAAYKIGKEKMEYELYAADPEAFKRKLIEDNKAAEAAAAAAKPAGATSLSKVTSTPPGKDAKKRDFKSLGHEALAAINGT